MAILRLEEACIRPRGKAKFAITFNVVYESLIGLSDEVRYMTPAIETALTELTEYRDKLNEAVRTLEAFLDRSKLPQIKKEADLIVTFDHALLGRKKSMPVVLPPKKKRGRPRKQGVPVEAIFPKTIKKPKNGRRKKLNAKKKSKMSKKRK